MTDYNWSIWVSRLQAKGVTFADGLRDVEVEAVEARFGFRFPPDLRAFLQTALPCSKGFPDWRHGTDDDLRRQLDWPIEGLCFDVEHGQFWPSEWGKRPTDVRAAIEIAKSELANAPKLIPVYSHRYLPSEPSAAGNPVLSVYQSDIIVYGAMLAEYLQNEFFNVEKTVSSHLVKPVPYWDHVIESA